MRRKQGRNARETKPEKQRKRSAWVEGFGIADFKLSEYNTMSDVSFNL